MSEGVPTDTSEPILGRQFTARIVNGNVELLTPTPMFDRADGAWDSTAFRARDKTEACAPDPILLNRGGIIAIPRDRARKEKSRSLRLPLPLKKAGCDIGIERQFVF